MSTRIHKMLVDLIARKMREKGYTIVAMEGNLLPLPEDEKMPIPWKIRRHRPDLIGIEMKSRRICIGEAKTHDDLFSKRTATQFSDFADILCKSSGEKNELIIGVPLHSRDTLLQLLEKMKLPAENISIMLMPEELADNENEDLL
jgi:hypothetical protein